jgi:hypothetical protein
MMLPASAGSPSLTKPPPKTNLTRLRGCSLKGERLYGTALFEKWGTQTFIAGLTQNALTAPSVITGAMDGPAFETYVET